MTPQAEQKAIEGITVCLLCGKGIRVVSSIPIVGETTEQRAKRFVNALHSHILEKHVEQAMRLKTTYAAFAETFKDLLTLQCYATEDPVLQAAIEAARAPIHALTRRNMLTDDDMRQQLAKLGMSERDIKRVMPIAQYLRDFLSEQGNFEHPTVKQARAAAPPAASGGYEVMMARHHLAP